jgi:uncharacterized membrane protein
MAQMQVSTHIDATPEQVFDFIDRWQNAKRYMRRMVRYELVDPEGGTGVGARFRISVEAAGKRLNGTIEVTENDNPRRISFRNIDGVKVVGNWTLRPDGNGTHVTLDSTYEPPGGIIGRMVAAFISANARNDLNASLAKLKHLVEAEKD